MIKKNKSSKNKRVFVNENILIKFAMNIFPSNVFYMSVKN